MVGPRQVDRRDVDVVRAPVRDPDLFGGLNQRQFVRCQRAIQAPAAEIAGAGQPGIGGAHRPFVFPERQGRVAEAWDVVNDGTASAGRTL